MAVTAVSSTIDLKTQATFPIRLGSSIQKPAESKKFTGVRYNHKPKLDATKDVKCDIKPSQDTINGSNLTLNDGQGEYKYSGKRAKDGDRYVLFSRGTGKDKEMVLEKLDNSHDFNLRTTPSEADTSTLAKRYPQIPANESVEDGDDLFGDDDGGDEPPDASNPFDYRHYLKTDEAKSKESDIVETRTSVGTPTLPLRAASMTPLSKPTKRPDNPLVSQKKRRPGGASTTNPKRVKAGTEPPEPVSSTKAKQSTSVPKVRIDRKASLQLPPFEDSGELILENETPISERPPKRTGAMALALSGQLGQGPISLRSAASSPASNIASPMPSRPDGMEEGEEFELGGSSPEVPTTEPPLGDVHEDADEDDDDADADADVEDLELPSPKQTHRKSVGGPTVPAVDEDDDLGEQLALAMAEADAGEVPSAPIESDEESEEE